MFCRPLDNHSVRVGVDGAVRCFLCTAACVPEAHTPQGRGAVCAERLYTGMHRRSHAALPCRWEESPSRDMHSPSPGSHEAMAQAKWAVKAALRAGSTTTVANAYHSLCMVHTRLMHTAC